MVEPGGSRRSRGRGRRGRTSGGGGGRKNFNSKGPSVRVNGDAQQVYAKYMKLAEDATASGDYGAAEGLYQHAEHYLRTHNSQRDQDDTRQQRNGSERGDRDDRNGRGERGERGDDGDRNARSDRGDRGGRGERRDGHNGRDDQARTDGATGDAARDVTEAAAPTPNATLEAPAAAEQVEAAPAGAGPVEAAASVEASTEEEAVEPPKPKRARRSRAKKPAVDESE